MGGRTGLTGVACWATTYRILPCCEGAPVASPPASAGIGLPQCGHSVTGMPALASMGMPQLGQVFAWGDWSLATALGRKHIIFTSLYMSWALPKSAFWELYVEQLRIVLHYGV